jgi:hypothetical protein
MHSERGREIRENEEAARVWPVSGQSSAEHSERESLARSSFSTASWVALGGFMAAFGAAGFSPGVAIAITAATGAIGVAAVICGTILAAIPNGSRLDTKLGVDEDAYDVVSSRGD